MFHGASEKVIEKAADRAAGLMDLADDWRQQFNLNLYIQTYDAALTFKRTAGDSVVLRQPRCLLSVGINSKKRKEC